MEKLNSLMNIKTILFVLEDKSFNLSDRDAVAT